MSPKNKVSRQDIVDAAIRVIRAQGAENLNARSIAAALGCSTQPVFSNFSTMEDLQTAVLEAVDTLCSDAMAEEVRRGVYPPYKASGMAYIRFAAEEKNLFKLLYMRNRSGESISPEHASFRNMTDMVQHNTGMDRSGAELFHLEMWAFVHGIAAMTATGFLDLDIELVSRMLTDAYQGLRKHHGEGK